jgi:hypothetical protein
MVKDKRQDFNYFGMNPVDPERAFPFIAISILAIILSIFVIPAILNSEFGINLGILLAIYISVLEVAFIGVCLFTKFELSPKNVIVIKLLLFPFVLMLSPLLLMLYFAIAFNFWEILNAILSVLRAFGLALAICLGAAAVLMFFIYFNVAIAEALGQKPKGKK